MHLMYRLKVVPTAGLEPALHGSFKFGRGGGIRTRTVEILSLLSPAFGLRPRMLYHSIVQLPIVVNGC